MLIRSSLNKPNVLTGGYKEIVGGDIGYTTTDHINIFKPYPKEVTDVDPVKKAWNKTFNNDRGLIERTFNMLKAKFRIFDQPWRMNPNLFSLALRVCLKLLNKFWRLPGNNALGWKRIQKRSKRH